MVLRKYKKIFALIGITTIIFPVFFLASPKKAQAVVPVIDAANLVPNTATAVSTGALVTKEFGLDTVAYAVAGAVLNALTQSIVEWIRNGFQGQPGFITDFQGYLTDAADQATGQFMKEFLSPEVYNAICSPWRNQLLLALKRATSYQRRYYCTLSTVIGNMDNFYNDFSQGGWGAWLAVAGSNNSSPYEAYLSAESNLLSTVSAAQGRATTESIFNKGFLSMKKCTEYYDNQWTGEFKCTKYENTSPGAWVESQLSQATGIDMQRLAVADELNEILSALISQLLTGILQR